MWVGLMDQLITSTNAMPGSEGNIEATVAVQEAWRSTIFCFIFPRSDKHWDFRAVFAVVEDLGHREVGRLETRNFRFHEYLRKFNKFIWVSVVFVL